MERMKKLTISVLIILILFIAAAGMYGDIAEYKEIGYTSAYFTDLITKISIVLVTFLIFTAVLFINRYFVKKTLKKYNEQYAFDEDNKKIILLTLAAGLVCAIFLGGSSFETVLMYLNKTAFGEFDAVFGKDVSFYIFELPFYKLVARVFSLAFFAGIIYTGVLYYLYSLRGSSVRIAERESIIVHFITTVIIYIAEKAISLFLKGYEILFGNFTSGLTGAGITDIYFWKNFYLITPFVLVVLAIAAVVFLMKRNKKGFIISIAILPVLFLIFSMVAGVFKTLYVKPQEVTSEAPYIAHNIAATKKAYGIDKINEKIFDIKYDLSPDDITRNHSTIENIRITDNNATLMASNALQATKGYYVFGDVDILPYDINGVKRGVSTAVRELDVNSLNEDSKSYINTKMRYTHGYGAVMSNINSVTPEGQPDYIIQDVPLSRREEAPEIKVPQIYYGEYTNDYVIVGTDYKEYDYMRGGETVETTYQGSGGIKLGALNRIYYSIKNFDWMMLVSGYINSDSKMLLNRNIFTRAQKIAPYLLYDSDPYIVVNDEGRLIWVIDAYTVTDKYPYSQNYSGINYIRNSVKVTVDAYNGTMDFYITDETDPLAMTYKKIYPYVFKTGLPEDIAEHIRYPEFLFKLQMKMYGSYHVNNPETFYSKSDIWLTAKEKYNNSEEKEVEPYYNIMSLSEGRESDMVLMLPFIPQAKQNLIAWVGVSSNYDTYGDMVVYKFPEGSPVNGTLQIENLISSDPEISEQISLWDQGDSNVMKGNLLVIPIENSIIYVEPLYITSGTESSIPQVKRILMAYGDKVVMAENLDEAFSKLLGANITGKTEATDENSGEVTEEFINDENSGTLEEARLAEAKTIYSEVKAAFEAGDWALFGEKMSELEKTLGN